MRLKSRLGVAFGLAIASALWVAIGTVHADGGQLTSSANPSVTGQQVTFTYSFTLGCADGAQVTFTVDGETHGASASIPDGLHATANFSNTFSTAGNHTVVAAFDGSPMPNCAGTSPPLIQVVIAPEPPAPPPPPPPPPDSPTPTVVAEPSPSEAPTPAVAETPSPAASKARLNLTSNRTLANPVSVAALLLIAVAINAGLLISRRRRRVKGAR